MKLHEINDEIAKACDMRTKSVLAVQKETFRRLREILEKGDRVTIPGFGSFITREKPASEGGDATKSIRFRLQPVEENAAGVSDEERKARRQAKMAKKAAEEDGAKNTDAAVAAASDNEAENSDGDRKTRRQGKKGKKADAAEDGGDAAATAANKLQ